MAGMAVNGEPILTCAKIAPMVVNVRQIAANRAVGLNRIAMAEMN